MTAWIIIIATAAIFPLVIFYGDVLYRKGYTQGYMDCEKYHEETE